MKTTKALALTPGEAQCVKATWSRINIKFEGTYQEWEDTGEHSRVQIHADSAKVDIKDSIDVSRLGRYLKPREQILPNASDYNLINAEREVRLKLLIKEIILGAKKKKARTGIEVPYTIGRWASMAQENDDVCSLTERKITRAFHRADENIETILHAAINEHGCQRRMARK